MEILKELQCSCWKL